jgi:uncharacterized membrane protein YqaE (UPF0057 family)
MMLDDYFIIKEGRLLDLTELFSDERLDMLEIEKSILAGGHTLAGGYEIYPRIRGGGILDLFASILQIGKVFFFLLDLVVWLGKFIVWLVFFLIAVLKFMFVDLIFDFYNSIVLIIVTIFKLPVDIIIGLVAWVTNGIGGWMTTIWGWDQSNLTKADKNSNYFKGIDRNKGRKCYLTNNNKVPFSILLGTIICPPMGVFMDLGMTGWFNIMICLMLTLMFYVPGLVYALLVIYS